MRWRDPAIAALGVLGFAAAPRAEEAQVRALFAAHCAVCHGMDRLGGTGPALLPSNLGRLTREHARTIIAQGRAATQMPGFAHILAPEQIEALVAFIYREPETPPAWTTADIEASRRLFLALHQLPARPVHEADPLNLFVLIEQGDHHASIIDGDRLVRLARFPTPIAVHGGPKFSPDGRFVHILSRDGWVLRYDLWSLQPVGEVRAGINARNLAISADGRVLAVANSLPPTRPVGSRDLAPSPGDRGARSQRQEKLAAERGLCRSAARELRCCPQGSSRDLGNRLASECATGLRPTRHQIRAGKDRSDCLFAGTVSGSADRGTARAH